MLMWWTFYGVRMSDPNAVGPRQWGPKLVSLGNACMRDLQAYVTTIRNVVLVAVERHPKRLRMTQRRAISFARTRISTLTDVPRSNL